MVVFTKANGAVVELSKESLTAVEKGLLEFEKQENHELELLGLFDALNLDVENNCYQL